MAFHLRRQPLIGETSEVVLAQGQPDTAIVFVHGFNGDPIDTWLGFEDEIVANQAFKAADLFFFGYDGLKSNTLASASFLYHLLQKLALDPAALLGSLATAGSIRAAGYPRIILVAHSLGAVVTRCALLRAAEEQANWRSRLRTLYFAPAHCGSDLAQITRDALGPLTFLRPFIEGAHAVVPLIRELRPDSPLLLELRSRTAALLPTNPHLRANRVVIAEREIVVNNWLFPGDPFPDALRDTDHVSICKPTRALPEPVRELQELLR